MVERSNQSKGGSLPRAGVGFWVYQIELQHLAGFYLRTTIREPERGSLSGRGAGAGVDHYHVGWVDWTLNGGSHSALARVDNKICF